MPRTLLAALIALSFTALFLELMVIRWVPSAVRLVAYYANLMLISSFLGLGIGALVARHRRSLFGWLPLLLLLLAALPSHRAGERVVRVAAIAAAVLVAIDTLKELPITLLLRPFGWDTLAVRIYELTSEGEWERAALPAVALLLVGLVPVILLVRKSALPAADARH